MLIIQLKNLNTFFIMKEKHNYSIYTQGLRKVFFILHLKIVHN